MFTREREREREKESLRALFSSILLLTDRLSLFHPIHRDPQIHSLETFPLSKFVQTKGNLGERGIESFLAGHRCNAVCAFLRLPSVNPLDGLAYDAGSTMPSERYMAQQRVRVVEVQSPKANPHTPLLPPLRGGASSQSSSACPCCTLL